MKRLIVATFFGFLLVSYAIPLSTPPGHVRHPSPTPTPSPSPTATPKPTTPVPTVTLAWDASSGAVGYHFKYGFSPGGETAVQDVGNVTTWTLQVQSGTTYYFVVTAYDSAGESPPSTEISYTAP
jgi:hypothetical protein